MTKNVNVAGQTMRNTASNGGAAAPEKLEAIPDGAVVDTALSEVNQQRQHSSFADILKQVAVVPDVTTKKNAAITPSSVKRMTSICPELTIGLKDANGKYHPNTIHFEDAKGEFGPVGAFYIARFCPLTPADHSYIHANFGDGNRDMIPARQKAVNEKMKNNEWQFVGNTCIFTVDEVGQVMPTSLEEHNGGHTGRGSMATGVKTLCLMIFGIPKSARDKIDDNAARSAKDIASTRTEIKEYFREGTIVGGAFALTKQLAAKCKAALTEALRIVDDVRHGLPPKSGGARDKIDIGRQLDFYGENIARAIGLVVVLDSQCKTTDPKTGKEKLSGGLSQRVPNNHSVAILTLAASVLNDDGTLGWDEDRESQILMAFMKIANPGLTDATDPMVSFRMTIDRWNAKKMHDGSSGKNVRFAALKQALLSDGDNEEIRNPNWLDAIEAKDVTSKELQIGGIDDYVDDTASRVAKARLEATTEESPLPLIDENEMTEETSDLPTEEGLEEIDA